MKVLIIGNFAGQNLASSYKRSFEELGHEVIPVDIRERSGYLSWWLTNRYAHRLTIRSFLIRKAGSGDWNKNIIHKAKNISPDLIFILEAKFIMPETIKKLRELSGKVFIFNSDNPLPEFSNSRPEHLSAAKECDSFFIWSRKLVGELEKKGIPNVNYLPFAWDPEVHSYVPPKERPVHDVVFIGNWDRRREKILEPVAKNFDLKIWGSDYWEKRTKGGSLLKSCWQGKPLYKQEFVEVVANSKICINILREQNLPDGTNMRTFEVPGAGGFLLSSWGKGAAEIFPEEEAGAYFKTRDELIKKVNFYLENNESRKVIAQKAHDIVKRETYNQRVETILNVFNSDFN